VKKKLKNEIMAYEEVKKASVVFILERGKGPESYLGSLRLEENSTVRRNIRGDKKVQEKTRGECHGEDKAQNLALGTTRKQAYASGRQEPEARRGTGGFEKGKKLTLKKGEQGV